MLHAIVVQIKSLEARAKDLERHLRNAGKQNTALRHHLRAMHSRWVTAETDRAHLQDENTSLKATQVSGMPPASVQTFLA